MLQNDRFSIEKLYFLKLFIDFFEVFRISKVVAKNEQANMAIQLKSRLQAMRMVRQDSSSESESESEDSEWSD